MTQKNQLTETINKNSILKPILIGALIALALIALYLIPIQDPDPEWGKFWMVKPFILVTLAGAIGGVFFSFIVKLGQQKGWKKAVSVMVGLLVYLIGLWIGTVLGLDGTLWD